MIQKYEMVVGLEVHVELNTKSKIFCSCSTKFGASPNTNVCPVCMGLPGTLPVLNKRAVEYAIKAGLATGCSIAEDTRLDRKNYFYPDLPKAYQISQYDTPICYGGKINITTSSGQKDVRINRIHIEEDAGKLIHDTEHGTMIDYNRCGVPLIEIVSEPDICGAEEAKAYLTALRAIILYTGISDCRMNEGSFRCDVNLSVRKKGYTALGVRTEMKNINSFAFVAKAIEYEFQRQVSVIESGERVVPETRRFDSGTGKTYAMRSKESAADYRFFPEPDILPFKVDGETVKRLKKEIPMLPHERKIIYVEKYKLTSSDADVIVSDPHLARYFENAAKLTDFPKLAANILLSELLALSSQEDFDCPISFTALSEIADLSGEQTINSATVKKLIKMLLLSEYSSRSVRDIVKEKDLSQINDRELLKDILNSVITNNPKLISDYKNGKTAARKAIMGKVMSQTEGKANPVILNTLFDEITL